MSVQASLGKPSVRSARTRVAYSLAAGAVASVASNANAFVVYSGVEDRPIALGNRQTLEFDGDGDIDMVLKNYAFPNNTPPRNYQGLFMNYFPGAVVGFQVGAIKYVSALGAGVFVDQTTMGPFVGSMAAGAYNPSAQFNSVDHAYIGFGFPVLFDGSSGNHFGWMRVTIDNAIGKFIINDWAFETDPEVGITTGDMGDAGDFNSDGKVDAADYVMWRRTTGTSFDLGGHGDENGTSPGTVDHDDYTLWKANFGYVAPVGGDSVNTTVPEPISLGLLATGSLGVLALRRCRRER